MFENVAMKKKQKVSAMFRYQFHFIHSEEFFFFIYSSAGASIFHNDVSSPTLIITQWTPEANIFYRSSINKFEEWENDTEGEEETKKEIKNILRRISQQIFIISQCSFARSFPFSRSYYHLWLYRVNVAKVQTEINFQGINGRKKIFIEFILRGKEVE